MEQTTINADDLGRVLAERDEYRNALREVASLWHTALRQYADERALRRQWQDRTIRAEMLLRRCVALGALPCELRRQIATALDPRPCGCGPTDGCEKCRKPGALYQAIVRLWFRRPDGSAPNPLTDPPDEVAGVMQPTREGTAAFLSEIVLRHWDEKCGCQGDG